MSNGRLIVKDFTITVEAAEPAVGVLGADNDAAVVDVSDLEKVSIYLNQLEDAGNVTLTVTKSVDGVNFAPVGSKAHSDFVAGANKSVEITLSDSNGMPISTKLLKVVVSNHSSTGKYSATVAGTQRPGYR